MNVTINMTHEQACNLVCYLLMTTNYRHREREAWERLAEEQDENGEQKFPNAAKNAQFWADTDAELEQIIKIIDDAPWTGA